MAGKINVLFLHSQKGFGADSAIHAHLMRHLDRERFDVHVACTRGDGLDVAPSLARFREIPRVRLRGIAFAPGFQHRSRETILREVRGAVTFPFDFFSLVDYVRRHRIRLIHGTDRPRDAAYALSLAKLTGAKSIVHVHVAWSEAYSRATRLGVHHADAVFSISRFVTGTILASGVRRDRVHTILNCVDPSQWDPNLDAAKIRQEVGISPEAPVMVSVSRLFAQKGQRELLRALPVVRQEVPEVRLLIVGADAGYVHGGSFTRELKALAHELGVTENVVFMGERSDIPYVMAACDVFTMPSHEEPFGLVFLEAMAMGKPVVALDNGGTPEVVEHGRSGLLSSRGDIAAFARHVVTLLKDRGLRSEMGAYGRGRVLAYFNAQRMARDAGEAYEAVLGR
jgi:glycosyltransferase involved in cell wall biosynthesis